MARISRPRKQRIVKTTAVSAAAVQLREIILQRGDGAYLGSQEDLIRLLGVGRVTLQQTARLLERERLLMVRRGVNGGYFARLPDEAGVEETVAIYLRAKNSGYREAFPISTALSLEMARLAALSNDEAGRQRLRIVGEQIEAIQFAGVAGELSSLDHAYNDAVCNLANNPLGELILLVTRRLFSEAGPGGLVPTAEDRESWRRDRANMVRAILAHDEDCVQIVYRRFFARLHSRMVENASQPTAAPLQSDPPRSRRKASARSKVSA